MLQCPSVCVCVCDSFCVFFLKFLITPVYKGQKSNLSTTKRFLREKLGKDIGLRFSNFGSEIIQKSSAEMCEIVSRAPTTPLLLTFNIFQPLPAVFIKFFAVFNRFTRFNRLNMFSSVLHWCYYPHTSRDSVSPVGWILFV